MVQSCTGNKDDKTNRIGVSLHAKIKVNLIRSINSQLQVRKFLRPAWMLAEYLFTPELAHFFMGEEQIGNLFFEKLVDIIHLFQTLVVQNNVCNNLEKGMHVFSCCAA